MTREKSTPSRSLIPTLFHKLELTLLCPQQWAKQREQEFGFENGAQFITKGDFSSFQWDHNQHSIMDSASILPILTTALSFKRSAMSILSSFPALVSDAEDSDDEDEPDDATVRTTNAVADHLTFNTVDIAKPVTVEDPILPADQAEFLHLHERMGHSSFHLLQQMSKHGFLPSKFKRCRVPVCASCQQGKQHKKPWKTRADSSSRIGGLAIRQPSDCISVDQLKSSTPGLIGQVKGWLTRERRHHTATVFVDHHSDLTFVHVTPSDTSEETVSIKEAFECFAASHCVTVKHYHADNGRFADSLFRDHVKEKGQTISFCGVGAHQQNGKVEKRIKDTLEQARTMLLHASHQCPKAVSASLWPYALHHAVNIRNNVTSNPWSLQAAVLLSCFGPQSQDWACLSTVPCCVWWPLWHSQARRRLWVPLARKGRFGKPTQWHLPSWHTTHQLPKSMVHRPICTWGPGRKTRTSRISWGSKPWTGTSTSSRNNDKSWAIVSKPCSARTGNRPDKSSIFHTLAHHRELITPTEGAQTEGKGPEDIPPEIGWDHRDFHFKEGLLGYNPRRHIQCYSEHTSPGLGF